MGLAAGASSEPRASQPPGASATGCQGGCGRGASAAVISAQQLPPCELRAAGGGWWRLCLQAGTAGTAHQLLLRRAGGAGQQAAGLPVLAAHLQHAGLQAGRGAVGGEDNAETTAASVVSGPLSPPLWPVPVACAECQAGTEPRCPVKAEVWRGRERHIPAQRWLPAAAEPDGRRAAPAPASPPLLLRWPGRRHRDLHHLPHRVREDAAAAGREGEPPALQGHR